MGLYQRTNGVWYARWTKRGQLHRQSLGTSSRREAEAAYRQLTGKPLNRKPRSKKAAQREAASVDWKTKPKTLAEMPDRWEYHLQHRSHMKVSSIEAYLVHIRRWKELWGHLEPSELDADTIAEWHEERCAAPGKTGDRTAKATLKKDILVLSRFLQWAHTKTYIPRTSEIPSVSGVSKKQPRALSPDQVQALFSARQKDQLMELTEQQAFVVRNLYLSALVPAATIAVFYLLGRLARWVMAVYVYSFLVCALGWEIWYTYGLVGGLPVDARRAPAMSEAIPQHLNWVLTSLFDAAICLIGLFLIWLIYGFKDTAFKRWKWPALAVLFVVFVGQNIYVEYMIHDQVKPGLPLSWAPLIPTGPWFNFTLFEINDRSITFQTQLPWVLMVPLFSWLVFWCYRQYGAEKVESAA